MGGDYNTSQDVTLSADESGQFVGFLITGDTIRRLAFTDPGPVAQRDFCARIQFGDAAEPPIPATSTWGAIVLVLLLLKITTAILLRRRLCLLETPSGPDRE